MFLVVPVSGGIWQKQIVQKIRMASLAASLSPSLFHFSLIHLSISFSLTCAQFCLLCWCCSWNGTNIKYDDVSMCKKCIFGSLQCIMKQRWGGVHQNSCHWLGQSIMCGIHNRSIELFNSLLYTHTTWHIILWDNLNDNNINNSDIYPLNTQCLFSPTVCTFKHTNAWWYKFTKFTYLCKIIRTFHLFVH